MGSRALSHDSIFLADQDQQDAEPVRVLSQENVHGKIKALQVTDFLFCLLWLEMFFFTDEAKTCTCSGALDEAPAAEDAFGATTFCSADEETRGCGGTLRG